MNLVIVESPSKAKTINKYLGNEYKVISSYGHIMDLPKSKLGVDVEHNYSPVYEVINGKEKVIREIRANAKKAHKILLATDPDREGEAISWHIKSTIGNLNKNIERIVFHEITKPAILEALKHPRKIDENLVNAQQARRVLDRLVGYTLSPLLWKKIRYGLSAGRVQSVALRLIVDREMERREFQPEEYWEVFVIPSQSKIPKVESREFLFKEEKPKFKEGDFILEVKKVNGETAQIKNEKNFIEISNVLEKSELEIIDIFEKQITKRPNPPFTTSTFQQAAVNVLDMNSKDAMRVAQKLYENGFITYMRTDSLYLSEIAVKDIRKSIIDNFGKKYLPEKPNYYKNKSKSAQEAHEAIRPTSFETKTLPKTFSAQDQKVYDLIYRRALASQMAPAIFTQKTVTAKATSTGNIKEIFLTSTAQKCDFEGWMKLYRVGGNPELIKVLEQIKKGDKLYPMEINGIQHFTQPPARYTEASLIKALEKYGIGRPSTYASIVSVIMQRDYAQKDGKYFFPTETGIVVVNMLKNHFNEIVDVDFTARMEKNLDEIAEGKIEWQPMINSFFVPFSNNVRSKDEEIKKEDLIVLGESEKICEVCGKKMIKKLGRYGVFLSCIDFPKCKGMKSLDVGGNVGVEEKVNDENLKSKYKPAPKTEEGRYYVLKRGRFGYFWAHPDYPKVKDARPLEFTEEALEKMFGKPPKTEDGKTMILRRGRFGYFWAHPDYPKVKEIQKIKKSAGKNEE